MEEKKNETLKLRVEIMQNKSGSQNYAHTDMTKQRTIEAVSPIIFLSKGNWLESANKKNVYHRKS